MRGEIRLLGPVEVVGPLGHATLHGSRQRAVLAALALNAGTTVPRERLVDVLWDENPPRTAVRSLRSHVSRVRRSLTECGLPDVLRASEPGYLLDVASNLVDAHVFEHAVTAARDGATDGLRAALALWRGDALADAGLTGWGVAAIERLHEMRLCAWEYLWENELRRGRHESAANELARLLVAHPARERLVGLHMLAMYRCGRQTDALDAYRRHHAGATSRRAGHFTGREAELAELDGVLDDDRSIAVISGPGGMGKTALAVQWAHRIVARFPGGQLFLDMHGHDPDSALPVEDALTHLLLGLGVPDDRVPPAMTEKVGLYRSLLHQRRVLIVLDNCAASAELADLVPGAATSLLLVTSRNVLAPLMVRHAVCAVWLDALDPAESLTLLTRVLGAARVETQRLPAARLARLCGGMPLALRIAASVLALVTLPVLGMAPATADPFPADPNACGATGDYRGTNVMFQLVGQSFVPPSTTTRYWHVVDERGYYAGGYVVYCDQNHVMKRAIDLTRDHDNTEPAQLCGNADFATVEENRDGRNEAQTIISVAVSVPPSSVSTRRGDRSIATSGTPTGRCSRPACATTRPRQ